MPIQPRTRSCLFAGLLVASLALQGIARADDTPASPAATPPVVPAAAAPAGAPVAAPVATPVAAAAAGPTTPTQVRVTTNMGDFVIELRAERAPLTAANFLRYVREGFYSGTLFHRVVANFVIQGGGYDAATVKVKPTHESVFNESGNGLQNKRGAVGMARSEPPHSGNSQFFIDLVDNPDLDPVPTRWGYTVFGRVVQGMEVIERIAETPTGTSGPFKADAPLKPVIIQKVEIVGAAAAATAAPTPVAPARQDDNILSPK